MRIISITSHFYRWLIGDLTRVTFFSDKKSRIFQTMSCAPYDYRCKKELKVCMILWFVVRYEI